MTAPAEKTARQAYQQAAQEFGLSEQMVRVICGPIGRQNTITFQDRLDMLRGKLDAAGFSPIKINPQSPEKPAEPHELVTCVICENFLEEDDEGEPVTHSENGNRALICRHCVEGRLGCGT